MLPSVENGNVLRPGRDLQYAPLLVVLGSCPCIPWLPSHLTIRDYSHWFWEGMNNRKPFFGAMHTHTAQDYPPTNSQPNQDHFPFKGTVYPKNMVPCYLVGGLCFLVCHRGCQVRGGRGPHADSRARDPGNSKAREAISPRLALGRKYGRAKVYTLMAGLRLHPFFEVQEVFLCGRPHCPLFVHSFGQGYDWRTFNYEQRWVVFSLGAF